MALASAAIKSARVYLNDINGITWSDAILMPLLQEAHGELAQELQLNRTGNQKIQSAPITISAGSLTLGTDQPANIIEPISMMEGDPGVDPDFFEDMIRVGFLPLTDQTNWLTYWAWIGDVITFLGATTDRQIVLRYYGSTTTPTQVTDPLGCIFAERFIGPRIAALAYATIGRNNTQVQNIADENLYKLIQMKVTSDQRPVRRRAYRSPKRGYGPAGISVISGSQGGAVVTWIVTSTPADGSRTSFAFSKKPNYVSWNGLNQFQSIGYTLVVSGGLFQVTFIDTLGQVLTPSTGDDIRAEIS